VDTLFIVVSIYIYIYIYIYNVLTNVILTEIDEQSAVALPLVRWQRQDAGHVVIQEGVLLLEYRR